MITNICTKKVGKNNRTRQKNKNNSSNVDRKKSFDERLMTSVAIIVCLAYIYFCRQTTYNVTLVHPCRQGSCIAEKYEIKTGFAETNGIRTPAAGGESSTINKLLSFTRMHVGYFYNNIILNINNDQ